MTADKIPTPLEWLDERLATAAYDGAPLVTVSAWHLARVRDLLRELLADRAAKGEVT